jgi:hypothetical protein
MLRQTIRAIHKAPAILAGISKNLWRCRRRLSCISSGRLRSRPHQGANDPEDRQEDPEDEQDPVPVPDRGDPEGDDQDEIQQGT